MGDLWVTYGIDGAKIGQFKGDLQAKNAFFCGKWTECSQNVRRKWTERMRKVDGKDAESGRKANLFVVIETKEVSLCAL
jgi:hypothetical protein